MTKSKTALVGGTEPGFNAFNDTDAIEPQIADILSVFCSPY